jgi:DNA modification methylase
MTVSLLEGHVVDVLASLPAGHFHCAVTSPPYLWLRAYGTEGQTWEDGWLGELGQESTPELYVEHLVAVFRAVRRVLREDGTLWVNLAGCYYNDPGGQNGAALRNPPLGSTSILKESRSDGYHSGKSVDARGISRKTMEASAQLGRQKRGRHPWLKPLDWVDVPGLFARAMQQDGWTWRSDVVWVKPSALPESVSGTRWERCRTKEAPSKRRPDHQKAGSPGGAQGYRAGGQQAAFDSQAEWADCPGCPKCAANEGLVLRRGSGRPTKSTERILVFARGPGYFYDTEAVREPHTTAGDPRNRPDYEPKRERNVGGRTDGLTISSGAMTWPSAGRNLRDVWTISPEPISDAHYAAYPSALPERCIKAGTSEWGACPACGAPWARVLRRTRPSERTARQEYLAKVQVDRSGGVGSGGTNSTTFGLSAEEMPETVTVGWRPTCRGPGVAAQAPVPARVLDIFGGSGTTALAANRLGRDCTLVELKPEYAALSRKRIGREPLSLFAWQGQEALAPTGEDAPALAPPGRETTKQEQHPNRTVRRLPPLVEALDGAVGVDGEAAG